MFKVKSIDSGHVHAVYAVSGTMFLIWNDDAVDEYWEWRDMSYFRPLTFEDD